MDKVVLSNRRPFGGARIAAGQVAVDLWSDGVVIGTAWSMVQPEIAGELFTFRGTLTRSRVDGWRLEHDGSGYVDHFKTRMAALSAVDRIISMDAFRELSRIEAAR